MIIINLIKMFKKSLKILSFCFVLCLSLGLSLGFTHPAYATNRDNQDYESGDWVTKFCNKYDNEDNSFDICKENQQFKKKPQVFIYATKYVIEEGKSSILYWKSKRAQTCNASGGWSGNKAVMSAEKVTPATTTTYTITCTNNVGSYTDSVEIWVNHPNGTTTPPVVPPPATSTPTLSFTGNPLSIMGGATSTLSWQSTSTTACTASNGWSGSKGTSGTSVVSPVATTTYVLACSGPGGTATSTVIIGVTATSSVTTTPPPPLNFTGNPLAIMNGATSTLTWFSTSTTACTASNGWSGAKATSGTQIISPTSTTTYALSCSGPGGMASSTVTIGVTATSSPATTTLNHLLLSEVYYDVGSGKGSEPANEWVEIYNGTGSSVDISGWFIADASSSDAIPASTVIPNGGFLVLTASSTTSGFWGGVPMINLGSAIGNGLGNAGDAVYLKNAASTTIDAMSYGTNTSVFNPSAPDVVAGHSLKRTSLTIDTDTASDWADAASSTPGSF